MGLWTHPAPGARWLTFLYLTARTRPGVITFSSLLPVFPSWSEEGERICEGEGEGQSSGLRPTLLAFPWSQWTISLTCLLSVCLPFSCYFPLFLSFFLWQLAVLEEFVKVVTLCVQYARCTYKMTKCWPSSNLGCCPARASRKIWSLSFSIFNTPAHSPSA